MKTIAFTIAATATAIGLIAATAGGAEARSFSRGTSVQGPHGHGYERGFSYNRSPGHMDKRRYVETNSGRGGSRSVERNWGAGHYDAERGWENNRGGSRTVNTSCDRGTGCDRDITRTWANGETRTRGVWLGD